MRRAQLERRCALRRRIPPERDRASPPQRDRPLLLRPPPHRRSREEPRLLPLSARRTRERLGRPPSWRLPRPARTRSLPARARDVARGDDLRAVRGGSQRTCRDRCSSAAPTGAPRRRTPTPARPAHRWGPRPGRLPAPEHATGRRTPARRSRDREHGGSRGAVAHRRAAGRARAPDPPGRDLGSPAG